MNFLRGYFQDQPPANAWYADMHTLPRWLAGPERAPLHIGNKHYHASIGMWQGSWWQAHQWCVDDILPLICQARKVHQMVLSSRDGNCLCGPRSWVGGFMQGLVRFGPQRSKKPGSVDVLLFGYASGSRGILFVGFGRSAFVAHTTPF